MPAVILDSDGFGGSPSAATQAVSFLKTLSHEGRLQILCLLLDQDLGVGALAEALGMSQPLASQQLMRLRAEGYVGARREGKAMIYHLLRPEVKPVIAALRDTFCAMPSRIGPSQVGPSQVGPSEVGPSLGQQG